MSDLPSWNDATDAVEEQARSLLPWLPDPYTCDKCGVLCEADRTYDPQTAAFHPNGMAPSWVCPECGASYRRVEPWDE